MYDTNKFDQALQSNHWSRQWHLVRVQLVALGVSIEWFECLMQRPVHPSYGRVKQNVDGCLFVWTGG